MAHADLNTLAISIRHLLPMNEFESAILSFLPGAAEAAAVLAGVASAAAEVAAELLVVVAGAVVAAVVPAGVDVADGAAFLEQPLAKVATATRTTTRRVIFTLLPFDETVGSAATRPLMF
jgi:hypothetical protein